MRFNLEIVMTLLLIIFTISTSYVYAQESGVKSLAEEIANSKTENQSKAILLIYTESKWTGEIHDGDYVTHMINGIGDDKFAIPCGQTGMISISINQEYDGNNMEIYVIKEGNILRDQIITEPEIFFEDSINCSLETISLDVDESVHTEYYMVGVAAALAIIIILILKKQTFLGPRKFRV